MQDYLEHTQCNFPLLERHEYGRSETIEAETSQVEGGPRPWNFIRTSVDETKSPPEPSITFSKVEHLGLITEWLCARIEFSEMASIANLLATDPRQGQMSELQEN